MWLLLLPLFTLPAPQSSHSIIFNYDDAAKEMAKDFRTAFCLTKALSVLVGNKEITFAIPPPEMLHGIDRLASVVLQAISNSDKTLVSIEPFSCISPNAGISNMRHYVLFLNHAGQIPEIFRSCYNGSLPGDGAAPVFVFPSQHLLSQRDLDQISMIKMTFVNVVIPTDEYEKPLRVYNFHYKKKLTDVHFDCDNFSTDPISAKRLMIEKAVGDHITIGIRFVPPYTYPKAVIESLGKAPHYYGTELALLWSMGFQMKYSDEHELGHCINGTCTGLLGELKDDDIDLAAGGFAFQMHSSRLESVYPFLYAKLVVVVKNDLQFSYGNNIQNEVWFLYVPAFAVSIVLNYWAERSARSSSSDASISGVCLFWFGVNIGLPVKKIRVWYIRLMLISCVWIAFAVRAAYQSNITINLLEPRVHSSVNRLQDLCRDKYIIFYPFNKNYTLGNYVMSLTKCTLPEENFVNCNDPLKCLHNAPTSDEHKYAAIMYSDTYLADLHTYLTTDVDCMFHVVDEVIFVEPISFLLKKRSPLRELIEWRGRHLLACGLIKFITNLADIFIDKNLANAKHQLGSNANFTPFSHKHLFVTFLIYVGGMVLSFLLFLFELIWYYLCCRNVGSKVKMNKTMHVP